MVIPNPTAQISDRDRNVFILSVYHRPKRLVQLNETAAVKLREEQQHPSAPTSDRPSLESQLIGVGRAAFIVGSSGLRCMITLLSLRKRCISEDNAHKEILALLCRCRRVYRLVDASFQRRNSVAKFRSRGFRNAHVRRYRSRGGRPRE